jgi:hypothetical protein
MGLDFYLSTVITRMLTSDEALAKVRARVADLARDVLHRELKVIDQPIRVQSRGWAFAYNTPRYLETKNPADGLVGNGPIFVDKETGAMHSLPSGGWPAWLEYYDRNGTPPPARQELKWVSQGAAPRLPTPRKKTE